MHSAEIATFASLLTPYELAYGPLVATQYALIAQRYLADQGVTAEQMASVSVAFREHASRNPQARYRTPITVQDVLASPMVSSPLHRLERPKSDLMHRACPVRQTLSEREQAVLKMVAVGYTSVEIGVQLLISSQTVNSHIKNIYGKCGISFGN